MSAVSDFLLTTTEKVRYADTDRQGHVNNAVFATFFETGRVELLLHAEDSLAALDAEFVIASLNLTFKGEIQWPGHVEIGTAVRKIGNSSIHLLQALFQSNECVAEAETVIVQIDRATRKSKSLTDAARERLGSLVISDSA